MDKYRITTRTVAGKELFQVYELIDSSAPDEEENRKKIGGLYQERWCAENLASILNKEDPS